MGFFNDLSKSLYTPRLAASYSCLQDSLPKSNQTEASRLYALYNSLGAAACVGPYEVDYQSMPDEEFHDFLRRLDTEGNATLYASGEAEMKSWTQARENVMAQIGEAETYERARSTQGTMNAYARARACQASVYSKTGSTSARVAAPTRDEN